MRGVVPKIAYVRVTDARVVAPTMDENEDVVRTGLTKPGEQSRQLVVVNLGDPAITFILAIFLICCTKMTKCVGLPVLLKLKEPEIVRERL
jgi:hypothetical protein